MLTFNFPRVGVLFRLRTDRVGIDPDVTRTGHGLPGLGYTFLEVIPITSLTALRGFVISVSTRSTASLRYLSRKEGTREDAQPGTTPGSLSEDGFEPLLAAEIC